MKGEVTPIEVARDYGACNVTVTLWVQGSSATPVSWLRQEPRRVHEDIGFVDQSTRGLHWREHGHHSASDSHKVRFWRHTSEPHCGSEI
jgi:hypothetical protein